MQSQGNRDTGVDTHDRSALGPELGCRWTHNVRQKVTRSLHHPPKQSPPPPGSPAGQGTAVLAPQKG